MNPLAVTPNWESWASEEAFDLNLDHKKRFLKKRMVCFLMGFSLTPHGQSQSRWNFRTARCHGQVTCGVAQHVPFGSPASVAPGNATHATRFVWWNIVEFKDVHMKKSVVKPRFPGKCPWNLGCLMNVWWRRRAGIIISNHVDNETYLKPPVTHKSGDLATLGLEQQDDWAATGLFQTSEAKQKCSSSSHIYILVYNYVYIYICISIWP